MAIEIERKFLVVGDAWRTPSPTRITQGYLNRDKSRTVRVRVMGEAAFLTVKGVTTGASRAEFEYPIPMADALALLGLCDGPVIDKWRHRVPVDDVVWEVDEFLGDNASLVVAEVELPAEDHPLRLPDWVGSEVTTDARYYNSALSKAPYNTWGNSASKSDANKL